MENRLGSFQGKRDVAQAAVRGKLSKAMETGQMSAYHTEGELVRDHYRLMFDVMHAATGESSDDRVKKLPSAVQEGVRQLDPSVIETLKSFPNMIRAAVLFHDIAKKPENRTVNISEMTIPADASEEDVEVLELLKQQSSRYKELQKQLEKDKKAAEKTPTSETKAKWEKSQADLGVAQRTMSELYDRLRRKYSGAGVYEKFKVGVGFQGHEKRSAEEMKSMELDPEAKSILMTVVEDHIIPLQKFDGELSPKECAKRYRQGFAAYSDIVLKLSVALASLDILGSIPADGKVDLTPVRNIFMGKREAWIEDRVAEEMKVVLAERLKGMDLPKIDYKNANPQEKVAFEQIRDARKQVEGEVEAELRKKFEALYQG
jgi:hypothetical protein